MDSYQTQTSAPQGAYPQPVQPVPQPAYVPQPPAPAPEPKGSGVKLVLGIAFFVAAIMGETIAALVAFAVSDEILVEEAVYEVASAVIALVLFAMLGGWRWLKLEDSKVVRAIRDNWWLLLLDAGLVALSVYSYASEGDELIGDWFGQVLITAVMCLGIGLCEEGMFRGLLHNSFLASFGKTRKSVVCCALMSALVFGLFHVLPADESDFTTLGVIQMVLKTVQTGICGFVWAIIATRDDDLWGVAIVHGLSDFLLMAPEVAFGMMDSALSTEYVSSDEEAMETIVVYLITIAAYLPLIVRAIKIARTMDAPDYGAYVRPALVAAPAVGYGAPVGYGVAGVASVAQAPAVAMPQAPVTQAAQGAWQQVGAVPQQAPTYDPQAAERQDAAYGMSMPQQAARYPQYPGQQPQQPTWGASPAGGPPRPSGL